MVATPARAHRQAPVSAGFFDPVHPPALAVAGSAGQAYLRQHGDCAALARQLHKRGLRVLLIAEGASLPQPAALWTDAGITIAASPQAAHELVYALRQACAEPLLPRQELHAVLVAVHGLGVLLRGPSAVGKSELALDLLDRGHRLVADDVVELRRPASDLLVGSCPPLLAGYLEVRGLGILDVRQLFGPEAVSGPQRLDLVIDLERPGNRRARPPERLGERRRNARLLGVTLPRLSLVAGLGHNLAVLLETACRDTRRRLTGENDAAGFAARQQAAIHFRSRTPLRT